MWFGKALGAALGLVSGGLIGSLIGAFAGHMVDKKVGDGATVGQVQQLFFRTTFRFMGRLAKADGRVSEAAIAAASQVMQQIRLTPSQRQVAIDYFNQGKDPHINLDGDLQQLRALLQAQPNLMQLFFEIQLSVAYADGELSSNEKKWLEHLRTALGVSQAQFEVIHSRVLAGMTGRHTNHDAAAQLRNAYAVLGLAASCDDAELKKTYRKLMSQHHPDKLIAKGLPEEMMTLAKEKTQQIQTAYDLILKARAR